jgi:hypothetical protein
MVEQSGQDITDCREQGMWTPHYQASLVQGCCMHIHDAPPTWHAIATIHTSLARHPRLHQCQAHPHAIPRPSPPSSRCRFSAAAPATTSVPHCPADRPAAGQQLHRPQDARSRAAGQLCQGARQRGPQAGGAGASGAHAVRVWASFRQQAGQRGRAGADSAEAGQPARAAGDRHAVRQAQVGDATMAA